MRKKPGSLKKNLLIFGQLHSYAILTKSQKAPKAIGSLIVVVECVFYISVGKQIDLSIDLIDI